MGEGGGKATRLFVGPDCFCHWIPLEEMCHIQAADRDGCFHRHGVVVLASGQQRFVRDVKAGDVVSTASSGTAHVLCTTRSPGGRELCFVGSALWVTPKHPIRIQGA
jgi:hypothetical protein